jgi:hypothetical protein
METPSVTADDPPLADWTRPTRVSAALYAAKAAAFRLRRGARDLVTGPDRHGRGELEDFPAILSRSRTPLWSDLRPGERAHQRGKVHNLRRAAAALNGVMIPEGEVFSFWRQIGPATPARGYASGRMLQQGCLVPSVGGGLCQISNALYQTALESGCEIVERHAHSRAVPGSATEWDRDATVAWNYVDLRFRPKTTVMIEAFLTADELVLRLRGHGFEKKPRKRPAAPVETPQPVRAPEFVRTCSTCDETSCYRHDAARRTAPAETTRAVWLVDENWPELQAYAATAHAPEDLLAAPFDGKGFSPARYCWRAAAFGHVSGAPG